MEPFHIATYDFLLYFHSNRVSILHRFRDIIIYFPKLKEVTWLWTHRLGSNLSFMQCTIVHPNINQHTTFEVPSFCDRPGPQINNTRIVSSFTFYYYYYYSSLFMSKLSTLSHVRPARSLSERYCDNVIGGCGTSAVERSRQTATLIGSERRRSRMSAPHTFHWL